MRTLISASLFVLACALAQPAARQVEEKPVPMDKAPFHIPVFSNDYIILLNVNIPPGRNTGYHTHYADSVSVNLTPASQTNQDYGSSQVSAPGSGGDGEPGRARQDRRRDSVLRVRADADVAPGRLTRRRKDPTPPTPLP